MVIPIIITRGFEELPDLEKGKELQIKNQLFVYSQPLSLSNYILKLIFRKYMVWIYFTIKLWI